MSEVKHALGATLVEKDYKDAAKRVGDRIREIRSARNLSQLELGKCVGLCSDRIQKYENGHNKPRLSLLIQIAEALDVDVMALEDPVISNELGVLYALIQMQEMYNLRLEIVDGRITLLFEDGVKGTINTYLSEWDSELRKRDEGLQNAFTEEAREQVQMDYNIWKWTLPDIKQKSRQKSANAKRKKSLLKTITLLSAELAALEEDDNE